MNDAIKQLVSGGYELYMPQVRFEMEMLTTILLERRITSTLEIGTKYGGSAYVWCQIMTAITQGEGFQFTSIDLPDGPFGGIDQQLVKQRCAWMGLMFPGCCRFVSGDSHTIPLPEVFNSVDFYDFLFIDGDHSYSGVKADFEKYLPVVASKGVIAFHDIVDSPAHQERGVFVHQFWEEIKNDPRFYYVELIGDRLNQDWAGIGVLILKD